MVDTPKYSIIIPARNGGAYLSTAIRSVIDQNFDDFELIVSDNQSWDKTSAVLEEFDHPKIKKLKPSELLSMTDNWEFALSHAKGEWLIFVGVDDGLQAYFFELAEKLTFLATKKSIRAITSKRAYYFYHGCEPIFGPLAVKYRAEGRLSIRSSFQESLKSLFGFGKCYFELPTMYSTSLFHRSLIERVKEANGGKVFSSMCPDANLAAIACSLEKKYLESGIPLGWVGSSSNSAGLSASIIHLKRDNSSIYRNVQNDVVKSLDSSAITFHELAGDYKLNSPKIFYWEALLKVDFLQTDRTNTVIRSKWFKTILLSCVYFDAKNQFDAGILERLSFINDIVTINKLNIKYIRIISFILRPFYFIYWLVAGVFRRLKRVFSLTTTYDFTRQNNQDISLLSASSATLKLIKKTGIATWINQKIF